MNKEEQKIEVNKGEEFIEKYKKLCEEYGFEIAAYPEYISRDDGTFSLVIKFALKDFKKPAPGIDKK